MEDLAGGDRQPDGVRSRGCVPQTDGAWAHADDICRKVIVEPARRSPWAAGGPAWWLASCDDREVFDAGGVFATQEVAEVVVELRQPGRLAAQRGAPLQHRAEAVAVQLEQALPSAVEGH